MRHRGRRMARTARAVPQGSSGVQAGLSRLSRVARRNEASACAANWRYVLHSRYCNYFPAIRMSMWLSPISPARLIHVLSLTKSNDRTQHYLFFQRNFIALANKIFARDGKTLTGSKPELAAAAFGHCCSAASIEAIAMHSMRPIGRDIRPALSVTLTRATFLRLSWLRSSSWQPVSHPPTLHHRSGICCDLFHRPAMPVPGHGRSRSRPFQDGGIWPAEALSADHCPSRA